MEQEGQKPEYTLDSTVLHFVRRRLITDLSEEIRTCLATLTEEEIWWRPNEKANSIGNLVLHLCGSTRFYLLFAIADRAFERDRPAEFEARHSRSKQELVDLFTSTVSDCNAVLSSLDSARLMEKTDRTGKQTTFAQILLHVLSHFSTHTGQIVYTTKMLKEGAIVELWMKTRS
jgi:uncharacterized damage-inducible protein DinB